MAINVDTVYKTVLLILNKEQRGYMTPNEFNKTATQVQLDIFEQYFDDLNQQLRVPQSDYDYSDRQMSVDIQKSPLTASTKDFPTYLYESNKLTIRPASIVTGVSTSFIRKPRNVMWSYSVGGLGQYVYDMSGSTQFELNSSEQVNIITRILLYSGIIIRDPQVIQIASSEIQQTENNKKS